jgi:hypothetical protein
MAVSEAAFREAVVEVIAPQGNAGLLGEPSFRTWTVVYPCGDRLLEFSTTPEEFPNAFLRVTLRDQSSAVPIWRFLDGEGDNWLFADPESLRRLLNEVALVRLPRIFRLLADDPTAFERAEATQAREVLHANRDDMARSHLNNARISWNRGDLDASLAEYNQVPPAYLEPWDRAKVRQLQRRGENT